MFSDLLHRLHLWVILILSRRTQLQRKVRKDKMKIILLTGIILSVVQTMFTSEHEKPNYSKPCHHKSVFENYENFTKKHIIQTNGTLNSKKDWERYLNKQGLWCRTTKQSFLPADKKVGVQQICSTSGLYVKGNLCSSREEMMVYEVLSYNCPPKLNSYINVTKKSMFVIVACNMVGKKCLPVHFEGNQNLKRTKNPCIPSQRPPTNQSKVFDLKERLAAQD
ncbi:uncharacterized protein LOC118102432 [Hippoglossus stenolepis]|uniref:uncharacterized protein LOC118102432 n=1 Tax=Hippoglossus stenolepis TaxID=195615 RepID=UPI001FAF4BE7|nr:uncharacterized protein LOC118102432 [Hippoglossus stenolepis]